MPWMCLERCGEDVSGDMAQIKELVAGGAVNAVSYEAFDLDWNSTIIDNGYSRVGKQLQAMGVETWPMITTANIYKLRELFDHPQQFIQQAIDAALNYEIKFTGYNIDFEPESDEMATNEDALRFAEFLTLFADALDPYNISLSVDIATFVPFWDYEALSKTTTDRILTMDTYCGSNSLFLSRLQTTVDYFGSRTGIGLLTYDPDTGNLFSDDDIAYRFRTLNEYNIQELDLWMTPIPDVYVPYMKNYLAGN